MSEPRFVGSDSAFRTTYLNEAPPPIEQQNNSTNYSLTIPEALLLVFSQESIQSCLAQNNNFVCISTSNQMQSSFGAWVKCTFKAKQFTSEELKLGPIITSIWMKTKSQIESMLKLSQDKNAIEDEKVCQATADKIMDELRSKGLSEKLFTERQANFLLIAINNIGKV